MSQKQEPILRRWEDIRRTLRWQDEPPPSGWGSHRGHYEEIELEGLTAHLVLVPVGQGAPRQVISAETVFVGIEGEVEFSIGEGHFSLDRYDILALGKNAEYSYANFGSAPALFYEYSSTKPTTSSASVLHLPWTEYRRQFHYNLPWADTWGSHRASGAHIPLEVLRGHLVRHPVGQSNPWHAANHDVGVLLLAGESEFQAAGKIWPLRPLDHLTIPAGTPFIYSNVGLTDVIHLSHTARSVDDSSIYWAENPGWPVRESVPTLDLAQFPKKQLDFRKSPEEGA